jgi:hypothetical protein
MTHTSCAYYTIVFFSGPSVIRTLYNYIHAYVLVHIRILLSIEVLSVIHTLYNYVHTHFLVRIEIGPSAEVLQLFTPCIIIFTPCIIIFTLCIISVSVSVRFFVSFYCLCFFISIFKIFSNN